jgi:hypothetical protein
MAAATGGNLLSAVGGFQLVTTKSLSQSFSNGTKDPVQVFSLPTSVGRPVRSLVLHRSMLSKVALVYFFENSTATIIAETPD